MADRIWFQLVDCKGVVVANTTETSIPAVAGETTEGLLKCVKAKCFTLLSSVESSHLRVFRSVEALRNKEEALQTQDLARLREVEEEESEAIAIVVPIAADSIPWKELTDMFSKLFDKPLPNVHELKRFVQKELPAKINVASSDLATWTCYSGDAELMSKLFKPNDVAHCTEFKSLVMERILRPVAFELTTDASAIWLWDSLICHLTRLCVPRRLLDIALLEPF